MEIDAMYQIPPKKTKGRPKAHPPLLGKPENLDDYANESLILPGQWFVPSRQHYTPEMRLMYAVLEDALKTAMGYCGSTHSRGKRLFQEAYDWFMADDNQDKLYSIQSICSYLNLDMGYLRQKLNAWIAKQQGKAPILTYDLVSRKRAYRRDLS